MQKALRTAKKVIDDCESAIESGRDSSDYRKSYLNAHKLFVDVSDLEVTEIRARLDTYMQDVIKEFDLKGIYNRGTVNGVRDAVSLILKDIENV